MPERRSYCFRLIRVLLACMSMLSSLPYVLGWNPKPRRINVLVVTKREMSLVRITQELCGLLDNIARSSIPKRNSSLFVVDFIHLNGDLVTKNNKDYDGSP